MPEGLSRDLMVRCISFAEQCKRYGGLDPANARLLDRLARQVKASGTLEIDRSVRPKIGTRIVREWRGRTYVVVVTDQGFRYQSSHFASLSHVARTITGTRWSGPRFFGLKPDAAHAGGEGEG